MLEHSEPEERVVPESRIPDLVIDPSRPHIGERIILGPGGTKIRHVVNYRSTSVNLDGEASTTQLREAQSNIFRRTGLQSERAS